MSCYSEDTYLVHGRDTGAFYQCRPSAIFGYLQDAATKAALELKIDQPNLTAQYNVFWMLARMWVRLNRPILWGDLLTIRTWHRGGRGVAIYRDYDIFCDGLHIGEGVSTWVLADINTRKLLRISNIAEFEGTSGGALCKDIALSKIRMPENMQLCFDRTFRFSDIDLNGHVNNGRYAECICDALELEKRLEGNFVSEFQVGYLAECRCGETIGMYMGQDEKRLYVTGKDAGGISRVDGAVTLSPLPEKI